MNTKKLFFFAIAALGLAACSNDEVVEMNENNAISFRTVVTGVTRSTAGPMSGTSWATGDVFNVYADFYDASATSHAKYFQADFTKQDGGYFTSTNLYYWPAFDTSDKMTFTAIYGATHSTSTVGMVDDYSPAVAAASQMDVMVAKKEVTASVVPVVLNFRHALSQIVVNVKNTNANLDFDITGVRIGYVSTTGDFTYSGGETGPQEAQVDADAGNLTTSVTLVSQTDWTPVAVTNANTNKYDQASTATVTSTNAGVSLTSFNPWLLIPQTQTAATAYAAAATGTAASDPTLNGSYIALELEIYNYNGSARSNKLLAKQWCYWPCAFTWNPGYKYTYTVDLAGGGYQPINTKSASTTLDPVLGDVIVFSPVCTIDYWVVANGGTVGM